MSTFRISKRENPFVQIDKTMIHDTRLSWKAKGVLMYLLSRPDDWKVYETEIMKHSTDGKASVRKGIKELIDCGYIERHKLRGEQGKFEGYEYLVYEVSHHVRKSENGKSENGKSDTTNIDITNKDSTNKKIYLIKDNEAFVFRYYSDKYRECFTQEHPTMNEAKNQEIISRYHVLSGDLDIDDERWMDLVDYHFDNLPRNNNGNILSFLADNGGTGCVYRYLEDMAYEEE